MCMVGGSVAGLDPGVCSRVDTASMTSPTLRRLAASLVLSIASVAGAAPSVPPGPPAAWPAAPAPVAVSAPVVRLAIVRTASRTAREATLFSGGRWGEHAVVHFSACLVQHGEERLLVDTGLGRRIDAQYEADMPRWMRPAFGYDAPVDPAADQLARAGVGPVSRVLLTHAHWDHASGLADFPGVPLLLAAEELETVKDASAHRHGGSPWPSQVGDPSFAWRPLALAPTPHEGFDHSLDLYGDGTVVIVAMPGHTPGSVGVFLRLSSGRRVFLVGDVVWHAGALAEGRPKWAPARWIVDGDGDGVADAIARIRAAQARDPALVVVPAHDGQVQSALGVFPRWVE